MLEKKEHWLENPLKQSNLKFTFKIKYSLERNIRINEQITDMEMDIS